MKYIDMFKNEYLQMSTPNELNEKLAFIALPTLTANGVDWVFPDMGEVSIPDHPAIMKNLH